MSYDLDRTALRRLTSGALAKYRDRPGRFLALAVTAASPLADVARTVERMVVEESFAMDLPTMIAEYRRYEEDSLYFLVLDRRTNMPAGAARVIDGGGKTLDDAPDLIGTDLSTIVQLHGLDHGRIWDFATPAVLPAYRGGRAERPVSSLLYRTFLNAGRLAGVRHVVAMLDHHAHRNLKLIGAEFAPMAGSEPFEYLGSPSTEAVHSLFPELIPAIQRQAGHLSRPSEPFQGSIQARGLRRLLTRRIAARVAHQIATGEALDESIVMPGLDRRQPVRAL